MPHRLPVLAAAAICLSLGGCAHQEDATGAFAWSYDRNLYEGAKLAYGAPHSDHVLLMMTCEPGAGRVRLSALSGRPRDGLVLGADRFRAESAPNVMGGGYIVEAETSPNAPSLERFAETGDLAMSEGRRRINLAARETEREGVRRFFQACGI